MDFHSWNFAWALCFAMEAFLATVGNLLTIIIFQKKQLRRRPHFLLISLAVADLLVGLVSIPLFIANNYVESHILLGAFVRVGNMLPGFASTFTLATIALERMYAIGWPFRHRVLKTEAYVVAIATPWLLAMIGAVSGSVLKNALPHESNSYSALLGIFLTLPVILTCLAYLALWMKERSRLRRRQVHENRDVRLTKTVAIITTAFLLTWLPFQILLLGFKLCNSCLEGLFAALYITKLLHYGNSVLNIFIYQVGNEEYRAALFKMLSCVCHLPRRNSRISQEKPQNTEKNKKHCFTETEM
ncbi:PREDICTED: cannabinoid receptor 2-like [Acropora digitifera]|uniref:cannabinoid receptor 2-like n=1 Tax=Acropora digitifera TaxID=70779 RepID=UPI00077AFB88|nr:PREDICTED: cannabinoid receptor 2-like [Acropora digitifera]